MRRKFFKLFICILLLVVTVSLPLFKVSINTSNLLTVISLFFAILVVFFIATATTNYLRLQSLIAEEDSGLIAVFNYCCIIAPGLREKIIKVIDKYAIAALSFELTDYVWETQREFNDVCKVVEEVNFSDSRGEELIQSLYEKKNSLYQTRQEVALVARRIVTPSHWMLLIILAVFLDILILTTRDGGLFSYLITGALLITTYLSLALLHDVDSNRFLEQVLSYENSQQIFKAIGTQKYYEESIIKSGRIPKPKENYRTGYYRSYDDNSTREVKI